MKPNHWISSVPMYQPGRPIEEVARELGFDHIDDILKVASNENELGPSPMAMKAMNGAASQMHRYPDGGAYYLKQKLAKKWNVAPENILPGNGSNELIELLGHVYLGPAANMVLSEMAFVAYRLVGALFQSPVLQVPMKSFTHDLCAMAAAINDDTRLVIVCNPNNPTGTINTSGELLEFVRNVPAHVLAVIDEAYLEYVPEEARCDLLAEIQNGRENLLLLRTFSKAYGLAGLRIGYGIGHPAVVALLNHARQPFNVNAMALAGAVAALDDTVHIENSRNMVREGLRFYGERLPQIGGGLEYVGSFANFILVRTGRGQEIFEALQKRKIIVRPMGPYGLPDWVRITIGTRQQNTAALDALEELLHSK